jgi:hypothetical protein
MQKAKHSLQFKEQALNKARQRGKQTGSVALAAR